MIIAVDVDDVLSQTTLSILEFYNKEYGGTLSLKDLKKFKYLGFLGETKEEAAKKLAEYNASSYAGRVKPIKGAIEALKELSNKHQLEIITSRPSDIRDETESWINSYFPNIFNGIHFNNNFTRENYVPGAGGKSHICQSLGAKVLIEDHLSYANTCPNLKHILLLDQPWNQGATAENVIRVGNWQEIVKVINNLKDN